MSQSLVSQINRPDRLLAAKMRAAEKLASRKVIRERDVVFRSDKPDATQQAGWSEFDDFDRKMKLRGSRSEQ